MADGIQERANADAKTQEQAAKLVERAQKEAEAGNDTRR